MGAIDIGIAAIDRASRINIHAGGSTVVNRQNPANDTGTITGLEVWLESKVSVTDLWIGTFSAVVNDLTCRDSESVGDVTIGSKQTFSGLDIDVVVGDYFGCHSKNANIAYIERDTSGLDGYWFAGGEVIDPLDSATFTLSATRGISLWGTGATPSTGIGDKSANMAAKMMPRGMI